MTRPSTIVRGFDLRLWSNRLLILGFILAGVGTAVFRAATGDAGSASRDGIQAAFSVFLAWAVARELDPDRPASAVVALPVGFAVYLSGPTNLGAVTAVLFAMRAVGDTPGASPTPLDLLWLPGLSAYAARAAGGIPGAAALAVGLVWDGVRRRRPAEVASGVGSAVVLVAVGVMRNTLAPSVVGPSPAQWAILAAGTLGAAMVMRLPSPSASADISRRRLEPARTRAARALAVAAAVATMVWLGGASAPALVGVWAAMIGVGIARAPGVATDRGPGRSRERGGRRPPG